MFQFVNFNMFVSQIHWSYAQIIFPASFAGQGTPIKALLFGSIELDHP